MLLAVLFLACNGGAGDKKTPTAVPPGDATSVATRPASGSVTAIGNIREVNLARVPDVVAMIADTETQLVAGNVIYADVTGDGAAEAIVPLSSGGTLGDIAFLVLTPVDGGTKMLLKEKAKGDGGLTLLVEDGKLRLTEPVAGPDDPFCCPSYLRHTTYAWNGAALAVESVTTDPNPDATKKGTPTPTTPKPGASP